MGAVRWVLLKREKLRDPAGQTADGAELFDLSAGILHHSEEIRHNSNWDVNSTSKNRPVSLQVAFIHTLGCYAGVAEREGKKGRR